MRPEGLEPPTDRVYSMPSDGTAGRHRIPCTALVFSHQGSQEFAAVQTRLRTPLRSALRSKHLQAVEPFLLVGVLKLGPMVGPGVQGKAACITPKGAMKAGKFQP